MITEHYEEPGGKAAMAGRRKSGTAPPCNEDATGRRQGRRVGCEKSRSTEDTRWDLVTEGKTEIKDSSLLVPFPHGFNHPLMNTSNGSKMPRVSLLANRSDTRLSPPAHHI